MEDGSQAAAVEELEPVRSSADVVIQDAIQSEADNVLSTPAETATPKLLAIMDQEEGQERYIFIGNFGSVEDNLSVEHFSITDLQNLEELQLQLWIR